MLVSVIGCGYVGKSIAAAEHQSGNHVVGLICNSEPDKQLTSMGIKFCRLDLDKEGAELTSHVLNSSIVYYLVPPNKDFQVDTRLQTFLSHLKPDITQKIVLFSTTGVYGDKEGAWVDENTMTAPATERALRRVSAENMLQKYCESNQYKQYAILRVGGIYGPGRLPLKRLREGKPVIAENESPVSNRIHRDDLVHASMIVADKGDGIYNACDGRPTTMTDYFLTIAKLAGIPSPPQITYTHAQKELSPELLSFINESRRIDNRKLIQLGWTAKFSDYKDGIAHSLLAQQTKE